MRERAKTLIAAVVVMLVMGGVGYLAGTAVTPDPVVAHDVAGCLNLDCADGTCFSAHDCQCRDDDGDGVCDTVGPCAFGADCVADTDGGGGGSGGGGGGGCFRHEGCSHD